MGSSRTANYSQPTSPGASLSSAWKGFTAWHNKVENAKPQFDQGLRAALGIVVPVFLGLWFRHPVWGGLAALCTFWTLLCDVGGAYRQKALAQVLAVVGLVLAFPAGVFCTQALPLEIAGTFGWVFLTGYLNVGGNAAAQASLFSAILFLVASAYKHPTEFWIRDLMCLLGGLWGMTLCLGLWIVHPFAPVFAAIGESYQKLAQLAHDTWSGLDETKGVSANLKFALGYEDCVAKITKARDVWGAVRARRLGPSARSVSLVTLVENAELIATALLGFRHYLNSVVSSRRLADRRTQLQAITNELGEIITKLAQAIGARGEGFDPADIEERLRAIDARIAEIPLGSEDFCAPGLELRRAMRRIADQVGSASDSIAELATPGRIAVDRYRRPRQILSPRASRQELFHAFFDNLTENFSFGSKAFRHALRLALATTGSEFLAATFHFPRGYWIPVTVLVIMKPNFGGTLQRAVQRITGTTGGALIAAAITVYIHEPVLLLATFAVVAFTAFTVRQVNFAFYTLWLTVMIMILMDIGFPGDWIASFWRVLHTVIGGGIAVIAGYLLFPLWEKQTLPGELAGVLRGMSDFVSLIRADRGADFAHRLAIASRNLSLLLANAETAGQRLVADPAHLRGEVTASLTLISAARQLFHGLLALAEAATPWSNETKRSQLTIFLGRVGTATQTLAAALQQRTAIPRLPDVRVAAEDCGGEDIPDSIDSAWIRTHLFELTNHLDVITESVRRIVDHDEE